MRAVPTLLIIGSVCALPARAAPVQVRGVVDTYWSFDLDRPASHERPEFLYSYKRTDEVNINVGLLHVEAEEGPVRSALGLMVGTFPQYNPLHEQLLLRPVYEARAGVRLAEGLWFDAGLFPSHIGVESAIGPYNINPTRSLQAENSPYYLAGGRITWEASDRITVVGVVTNGWQTVRQPVGTPGGAGGTGLQVTLAEGVVFNWSTFVGRQQPEDAWRAFNDLYLHVARGPLEGAIYVDVAVQGSDPWGGGTLMGRVRLVEALALGGRVEHFRDPDGIVVTAQDEGLLLTGLSAHIDVWPLSEGWTDQPPALWRLEVRTFHADRPVFGPGGGGRHQNVALTSTLSALF